MLLVEIFAFILLIAIYYLVIAPVLTVFLILCAIFGEIHISNFEQIWAWPIKMIQERQKSRE
jgi:hypothetical protein